MRTRIRATTLIIALVVSVLSFGQSNSSAILTNLATAKWTHDKGDPPGSESVLLREDPTSGGMELLVRYPAGHIISPHRHESNERIIVLEGRRSMGGENFLDPGGFAFLPANEVQRLSCVSKVRCTFYLSWDGKPRSYAVK